MSVGAKHQWSLIHKTKYLKVSLFSVLKQLQNISHNVKIIEFIAELLFDRAIVEPPPLRSDHLLVLGEIGHI